jgi:CDP-diacylglycerol--glycerol-3-phosphate 3-phosphatidyltransferase
MRITANQVTIARLIAMPFIAALAYGSEQLRIVAVILGTLVGLTDTVDGYLARKYGVTVLGSLLDPVADKVFTVVCYGICADMGIIPWWVAAAILARELGVTVLRSSLELRGRRLPSTNAAKAKTWVQMLGIGFVVLSPIVAKRGTLELLFGVPLAAALITMAILRLTPRRRFRPIEFAATVLIGFLAAAYLGGPVATRVTVLGFVVAMTWYSALDYIVVGFRELARPDRFRALHAARLVAGFTMPVVAMVALGTTRLPTTPLIVLLSVDMARGALDNYAANRRIADFSWGASLWAEIALLAGALAAPAFGTVLTMFAAALGVIETLRSLVRYRRASAPAEAQRAALLPSASLARQTDADPALRV